MLNSTSSLTEGQTHIHHADMEPLKPGHGGRAQNPRLASVQKDGLHDCLIELGAYSWGCILPSQHLPNLCPRPCALRSWLRTACLSSSSCQSRRPRYQNTSACSRTSPCTVNCWRKASADRTAMSRWWRHAVPTQFSSVLMCARHIGSTCIPQR